MENNAPNRLAEQQESFRHSDFLHSKEKNKKSGQAGSSAASFALCGEWAGTDQERVASDLSLV